MTTCWVCEHGTTRAPGFHRLHVAAALPHAALVKDLSKRRNSTYQTGRTAKLVLAESGAVQLHYRWYRPRPCGKQHIHLGTWKHVATLTKACVTVHLSHGHRLSQGARQRINDVLVHRGGSAYLRSNHHTILVYYETVDAKIAAALAPESIGWRAKWYAGRWAPVSSTLAFYQDRDPEGVKRWPKHARRPTV
mgnify:CR=1 FL=1